MTAVRARVLCVALLSLVGFGAFAPVALAQVDFGSLAVAASETEPVTVTIPRGGSFDRVAVVTKGAPNLDFTDANGGTCVAGSVYAAGATCMVNVTFSPLHPGLRMGAVVLYAGNEEFAKTYIHGNGIGSGRASSVQSPSVGQAEALPWASPQVASPASTPSTIYTVAGNCVLTQGTCYNYYTNYGGYGGDGGPATSALLGFPQGVAVDGSGNLYIADSPNNIIRKVDISGTITTVAGQCLYIVENGYGSCNGYGYSGDGGPATSALLDYPQGVAVDGSGNLYIADGSNSVIRMVDRSGKISTVAGHCVLTQGTCYNYYTNYGGYGGDGGPATSALLGFPQGVAVDGSGNLYIADSRNNIIRKVDISGTITTVAGQCLYIVDNGYGYCNGYGYSGNGGPATSALLDNPQGVAVDGSDNLYIADSGNSVVRMVDRSGKISTVAGNCVLVNGTCNGYGDYGGYNGGDGGPATSALLGYPQGVAVDGSGNLYIADRGNNIIRKVDISGTITTVAGQCLYKVEYGYGSCTGAGYSGDGGPATSALLDYPQGVAVDGSGNLYIADGSNSVVRMVTPEAQAAPPVFGLPPGTYATNSLEVGITIGANIYSPTTVIYYTTDGSTPTTSSQPCAALGGCPDRIVGITKSTTFKAMVVVPGLANSNVVTATYTLAPLAATPVFSVAAGKYTSAQTVTITDATPGATIYYTTNGTTPTVSSTKYAGAILVSAPGTETIQAIAVATGDTNSAVATAVYKIYTSPVGNLDEAIGELSHAATLSQSDTLYVSGWVADPTDGSPLSNVVVLIDGVSVGAPTLGIGRPDVASATNNPAYANSGFVFTKLAANLAVGTHTVKVTATNGGGVTLTLPVATVTVTAAYKTPVGNLDTFVGESSKTTTVPQSDSIYVSGWASDPSGAALSAVNVFVDGVATKPTTGVARPDVAASQGPAFANSGFTLLYPAVGLAVGTHQVTANAVNQAGVTTWFQTVTITVTAAAKPPVGNADLAVDSVSGGSPVHQADSLYVQGWAADYQANGPVASVTVVIDGAAVGTAMLGQSRPDVAAAYKDPAWSNTGWVFSVSASSVSVGNHTVTAYATDHTGLVTWLDTLHITVVP